MSRLTETRDLVAARVRDMKEAKVKEAAGRQADADSPAPTDITSVIEGWRGEEPVVVLMPSHLDRDAALHAAGIAAHGFGCDVIAVTNEGWEAREGHALANPYTGKPWAPGEMQQAVYEHGALEAGVITEALTSFVVNRAGDCAAAFQGYRITSRTSALGITSYEIEWSPPRLVAPEDGSRLGGVVVGTMVAMMNAPPVDLLVRDAGIKAEEFGLSHAEARAHIDCATTKVMTRAGFRGAVMLLSSDPVRTEIIRDSLGTPPLEEYGLRRLEGR